MLAKCVLILFLFVCFIDTFCQCWCRTPKIKNASVRVRYSHGGVRNRKTIRVFCDVGYELEGERFLTCIGRKWDDDLPSCIKNGCKSIKPPTNGKTWISNEGATTEFFCDPGFSRVGPAVVYCNGSQWNDTTVTTCVSSKALPALNCDFENDTLCGWEHDTTHDIDWKRFSLRTPSYYFKTGPTADHTFGEGKDGHYMYLESSGVLENYTARLISPIYDSKMTKDGCFSIFYNMYGITMGGLRVYQKPVDIPMKNLTNLTDQQLKDAKLLLFEVWGNQGHAWRQSVTPLSNFTGEYQIVIEGIRGSGYTSDVAIDDVAIMQGQNCTDGYKNTTDMHPVSDYSCTGRCVAFGADESLGPSMCGCSTNCLDESNCCRDYFLQCMGIGFPFSVDEDTETDEDTSTTEKVVTTTSTTKSTTTEAPGTLAPGKITVKPTTKKVTANLSTKAYPPKTTTLMGRVKKTGSSIIFDETTERTVTKRYTRKDVSKGGKKESLIHGEAQKKSSHAVAITLSILLLSCGIAALVYWLRTADGRLFLSTRTGQLCRNQEVRYLTEESD